MSSTRRWSITFLLAAVGAVAGGCASGAAIEDSASSGDGDGGSSGNGGGSGDGGTSGDGGRSSTAGPGTTVSGVTSSSVTAGATTSTSTSSSTSGVTASSSASSSSATTAAAATSSASGGGDPICDPLAPEIVCGAGQHCLPEVAGTDAFCDVAGDVPAYGGCFDNTECEPITECVDTSGDGGGPLPCCLQYCTGDADCPEDFGTCRFSDPPLLADGVQYGVCYDDGGGCF